MGDEIKCRRCGKYIAEMDIPMVDMISNLAVSGKLPKDWEDPESTAGTLLEFMEEITKGNYCICKNPQSINRWRVSEVPT